MANHKNLIYHETLVGDKPMQWLTHGATKRLVDNYLYHSPKVGLVASYTAKARDVKDHFGIFRGVDLIESFVQATLASGGCYIECKKQNRLPIDLMSAYIPTFQSMGEVRYHNYLEKGETFINIGIIKSYRFRQMVCDGRIYKVPKSLNLETYFKDYTDERLLAYDLPKDFKLVAELFEVTGIAMKKEVFNLL